jgi:quinol monooxygenase YgiN
MTQEHIVRMADLEIDAAQMDDYRALLAQEIETSVAIEPGVLMLHAVALRDDPHKIRILEVYANRSAYEEHLRTPHFLEYKNGTSGMVKSLRLIEVDPIAMLAKPNVT